MYKCVFFSYRASFTKQSKLAQESNSKSVPMGVEISADGLLTTAQIKEHRRNISFSTN